MTATKTICFFEDFGCVFRLRQCGMHHTSASKSDKQTHMNGREVNLIVSFGHNEIFHIDFFLVGHVSKILVDDSRTAEQQNKSNWNDIRLNIHEQ